jgi:metal-responsive CopG/Arc/MetJ family transcriptional regulator
MAVATVNLAVQNDFLEQIDMMAQKEQRSRAELIVGAIKMYIERKQKLQRLFAYGEKIASQNNFFEADVMQEIKAYRKGKKANETGS